MATSTRPTPAAAHKFEHEFRTQKALHLPFEPHATIADYKDTGVTLYTASQGPSFVRTEIARLLGWPENRVRIKVPYLGAGYGGKLYIKLEALALALSMIARRPVKVALTMEEMFYQITKHPCTFRIKSGLDKDGRIVARKCEVYWNGGAYADIGPRVTQKAGLTASGPYDIDHVSIDSLALYTNVTPAGALRGFGVPQLVWAYESHTDMMARALKLDPVEFRRKNLMRDGGQHTTSQVLKDAAVEKVMDAVLDRMNWSQPFDKGTGVVRRGRGFAIAIKAVTTPTTSVAIVNVSADGSATLYCSTIDMGQGSNTVLAQIVGEVLNIPAESVRVAPCDTDVTPYDMGTLGSRSTFHMGHAVRLAAEDARDKIRAACARRRRAGRLQHSDRRAVQEALRHAGRQRDRLGHLQARLCVAEPGDRPLAEHHAVLDGVRRRRRGRGRHRNRARRDRQADQRHRLRQGDQSEAGRDPDLRRRADASRLHDVREDAFRRRPGHQRLARRLQDPRHPRPARHDGKPHRRQLSSTTARSAPRVSARSRPSACRRRSPMRSTTRSASASPSCRSIPRRSIRALRAKAGRPLEEA